MLPDPHELIMERERDKLLHVAELLEADAVLHAVDWKWSGSPCDHCERVYRITRRFRPMATRIRRFWGVAVRIVADDQVRTMIVDKLHLLNNSRAGRLGVPCNPMAELAILREVLTLRAENAELRRKLK